MAYYWYVKAGLGTRTTQTSFTAAETGAFGSGNLTAANVFDSLEDVFAAGTPPTAGDYVLVSSSHSTSYSVAADIIINSGGTNTLPIYIICVSDSNADQSSTGAVDEVTTNYQYTNNGVCYIQGMYLKGNSQTLTTASNAATRIVSCTIESTGTNNFQVNVGFGAYLYANSSLFKHATSSANPSILIAGRGAFLYFKDCSFANVSAPINAGQYDGYNEFVGCDLTDTTYAIDNVVSTDTGIIRLFNCQLPTSYAIRDAIGQYRIEIFNSDDATDDDYHRFYIEDNLGTCQNNDATYVTATETWYEGSAKSSIEVTTTATCSIGNPFIFDLPARYVNLATDDILSIELLYDSNDVTLNDADIVAFLAYPDGTTAVTPRLKSSTSSVLSGTQSVDALSSGSAFDTSVITASGWTESMTTPTAGKLTIDTSGTAGQASGCVVRIEVYSNGSGTGIASGDLFIHPIIQVTSS